MTPIPAWFRLVAKDGMLNTDEVAQLFSYANPHSLHCAVHDGYFPPPDVNGTERRVKFFGPSRGIRNTKNQWKKSTVIAEMKRRGMLQ